MKLIVDEFANKFIERTNNLLPSIPYDRFLSFVGRRDGVVDFVVCVATRLSLLEERTFLLFIIITIINIVSIIVVILILVLLFLFSLLPVMVG